MKKWKECGAVDEQACGKKSPEAQGERWRACTSGVQERAPKAQGEHRSLRSSVGRSGRAPKRERGRPRESAGGSARTEAQRERRPKESDEGRERVQTQKNS